MSPKSPTNDCDHGTIGIQNDGMVMLGVPEFWQMVIKGLDIVLAIIVDQIQRNLRK